VASPSPREEGATGIYCPLAAFASIRQMAGSCLCRILTAIGWVVPPAGIGLAG
jgi:hypothetical protein